MLKYDELASHIVSIHNGKSHAQYIIIQFLYTYLFCSVAIKSPTLRLAVHVHFQHWHLELLDVGRNLPKSLMPHDVAYNDEPDWTVLHIPPINYLSFYVAYAPFLPLKHCSSYNIRVITPNLIKAIGKVKSHALKLEFDRKQPVFCFS